MKKFSFVFFLIFCLFSCSTRPGIINRTYEKEKLISDSCRILNGKSDDKLKVYFPLITNSENIPVAGDGIVLIFPNGEVMVIDGFYSSAADKFIQFLKDDLKIEKIHYLVATHYHSDHIGSFNTILDLFQVEHFYSNGALTNSSTSIQLAEKIKQLKIPETILTQGDILQIGDSRIDVLWPALTEEDLYKIYYEPGKTAELINLSSLVMKLSYKDFSILFTGDLYRKGEKKLVAEYGNALKSTVLKAPHHGDPYTSNSIKFLLAANPELTIAQNPDDFIFFTKVRFFSLNKKLIRVEKPGFIKLETTGFGYSVHEFVEN